MQYILYMETKTANEGVFRHSIKYILFSLYHYINTMRIPVQVARLCQFS